MKKILTAFVFISSHLFAQDIEITSVTGPKTFDQFEAITATIETKNNGIIPISGYDVNLYLSSDNIPSNDDYYVGGYTVLNHNASSTNSQEYTYPYSYAVPGNYSLIVIADPYGGVNETDEGNNVNVIQGYKINPPNIDFEIKDLYAKRITSGQNDTLRVYFTITNSGLTKVGRQVSTSFFLSKDETLSQDDVSIGYSITPPLNGLASYKTDALLQLPAVTPDNYFIIGNVDGWAYAFPETNELNNTDVIPIAITYPDIDLEITNVLTASVDRYSDRFHTSFSLRNNGTTGVGGYEIEVTMVGVNSVPYKLPPVKFDDATYYVSAGDIKNIAVDNYTFAFFPQFGPGWYKMILQVNPSGTIKETNTSNNYSAAYDVYVEQPPVPSLTITEASFTESYYDIDKQLQLEVNFTNSGESVNHAQSYTLVISNKSSQVHTIDKFEFLYLIPGGSVARSWQLSLPQALSPGDYTVTIRCSATSGCYTNEFTLPLKINKTVNEVSGKVVGEDGIDITNGKLFLYKKDALGKVRFTQQLTLNGTNDFKFEVDDAAYTLYFVPDKTNFAEYVPTIFGKTVLLNENSFFNVSGSYQVTLEVLKIKPLAVGPGIIGGSASSASSPLARGSVSLPDYSVILLSSNGDVVNYTLTDADGNFEFKNLPRDIYQVVIGLGEDEEISVSEDIDITVRNRRVDFVLDNGIANASHDVLMLDQTIDFNALRAYTYGDNPIPLNVSADSDLPLIITSDNNTIAEVVNNTIVLKKPGEVTITAT